MNADSLTDTTTGALTGGVTLVLGTMPRGAEPETHWAAGPWCFAGAEDFFPDWEDRFVFAPEPLRDLKVLERAAKEAQALCVDSLPALAARLCPHSAELPAPYWETLLTPWAIDVAKQIVERWQRVKAMTEAWGHLPLLVPLLPENCTFSFRGEHDFTLHGALGVAFNHWLLSRLLEAHWPEAWRKEMLPPLSEAYGDETPTDLKGRLRQWARRAQLRLLFPRLKGMSL